MWRSSSEDLAADVSDSVIVSTHVLIQVSQNCCWPDPALLRFYGGQNLFQSEAFEVYLYLKEQVDRWLSSTLRIQALFCNYVYYVCKHECV